MHKSYTASQTVAVFNFSLRDENEELDHSRTSTCRKQGLSYFNIPGECPMLGMTVGDMIDFAASKYEDAEAFVAPFQNVRRSFRQLQRDVSTCIFYFFP